MSKKAEKEINNSKNSQVGSSTPHSERSKEVKQNSGDNKKNKDQQVNEVEEKITSLKKELEDYKEKNLRLLAELKNQEKNHRSAITEAIKYGNERLIQQFLFFPDNYERAMQVVQQMEQEPTQDPKILQKKIKDLLEGLRMILLWFQNILQKQGIEEIKVTSLQDNFNPDLHTALEVEESNDHPEGTVLQVLQKGYKIHDRILRPTTVKISKKLNKNSENKKN